MIDDGVKSNSIPAGLKFDHIGKEIEKKCQVGEEYLRQTDIKRKCEF